MAYERVNWENLPSTKTPINQTNLNKMENGIDQAGAEIFVGTEEPTAGEKVWFNKNKNSIYVRNSNGVYEEFIKNNIKEISFTKNDVNSIFYYSIYATENEVQISADIRYNFTEGVRKKVLTIEKGYEALLSNVDGVARFPISTDSGVGVTGYADVNTKGEVYIATLGAARSAYINIRYRYK